MKQAKFIKAFIATVIVIVVIAQPLPVLSRNHDGKMVLVVDAGHGGHDAGALGTYSQEKNINLNVALSFGKLVEQNCKDVKVIYTRKKDVFVPLQERASIANRNKADLFVSIHTNALPNGRIAYGSETYTLGMARSAENFDVAKRENSVILIENNYKEKYAGFNPNSSESYIIFEFMQDEHMKQSISLAKSIQKRYVSLAGRKDKGVHQAGFLVLRETSMPSVLTELGFITTPEEEAYLNSQEGIKKLARSIYEGFLDYKQSVDGKVRPVTTQPQDENEDSEENTPDKAEVTTSEKNSSEGTGSDTEASSKDTDNKVITSVLARQASAQNAADSPKDAASEKKAASNAEKKAASNAERKVTTNAEIKESASEANVTKTKDNADKIEFRIQFMTSDVKLKDNDSRLKGYSDVDCYQDAKGGLYKYTCSPTEKYEEAQKKLIQIKAKVKDAFIVAFKNGKRVNLFNAIQEQKSKGK